MSELTHKTAVVAIPPAGLWPPIEAIRREHDRHVRRWMPHITLIYPFLPKEDLEEAVRRFSMPLGKIAPFTVRLAAFRFFHHGHRRYTLWLDPEPAEAVAGLRQALLGAVPQWADTPF